MKPVRPTRFYSNRQEKHIAKAVAGKKVSNSGASPFHKGDVISQEWLFEAKTKVKPSGSFTIKRSWIDKNKEEAFAMNRSHSALVLDFGDGEQFYLVDEKTFLQLLKEEK